MTLYADIILPLAQPAYTFSVGEELSGRIRCGMAVAVQLGARKIYTGIVRRLHEQPPPYERIKPVLRILYDQPLLDEKQLALWDWMADYYLCTPGDVMRVALPGMMKPSGLSGEEFRREEFRPRMRHFVSLQPEWRGERELHELLDRLERRAPSQHAALAALLAALSEGGALEPAGEVPRELLSGCRVAVQALERKGIVRSIAREEPAGSYGPVGALPELTPAQAAAEQALRREFAAGRTALLHGVTGSGKTEIYLTLIARTIARGEDALLLLPEIAMTGQLIRRLRAVLAERVVPYHSKLPERRRTEAYMRLLTAGGGSVVVGTRSALFLPLRRLGLVVVDEEHDGSYKQSEPAPRYHARDCALMLARLYGARAVLGSATPSLESMAHALSGKYGRVELAERYGGARLPHFVVSDTLLAARRGERRSHFNKALLDGIAAALQEGGQAMLFQNRRGYSPYVECDACGWTARCPACNVTLSLHKRDGELRCHYCGHAEPPPSHCPACGGAVLPRGFGTEKVEQELAELFPEARIERLDRDTSRTERAYGRIVSGFEQGQTDILVGTQMITKGFDFSRVRLVGILNADNLLNQPDFRASERAFQLMTQVAGRAGRRTEAGEVVIQTAQPDHPVIRQVAAGDYAAMAREQLRERSAFFYPPYVRLIALQLRSADADALHRAGQELGSRLRRLFESRLLGPQAPAVDRIRGEHLLGFLLKVENSRSFARAKALLKAEIDAVRAMKGLRGVKIVCDVDPQ